LCSPVPRRSRFVIVPLCASGRYSSTAAECATSCRMNDARPRPAEPSGDALLRPLTVRVRDACQLTGIGRSKLYLLIGEGQIETIKVGSITLIPMRSLERFLGLEDR
jgi:excisionase family DNA binding protein